ncbi:hypothetical protein PVAP13_9KG043800 [Panicum virgatum]|uniref:Uncharacterized protein n=1 Tax=Panicum virgatum TaxID=38727 RepID=A0A8T0NEY9_PANVG|nr:hypothetical protein PVAP13_9KG043800 [Panicum virgatum]
MSRSFFPTCSSQKAEMEEMSKELDDLRARLADKEQALRHLCAAHEALKGTLRERTEALEADKRGLLAALEDAEAGRAEQEAALRARDGEVARLRGLLSEKERRCGEAEKRALAPRAVAVRGDMLVKLEEEKAAVESKLKWKAEQFRHLEEALKKVQDDFRVAKREWGSDRSTLVDRIGYLEADLDSKTRVAEDFRSRLEMCSQALAHEEGRRKRVEAEMSELRHMYGNVVSEYEEAKSMVESLTINRDGEIASLRSSMAEKVTLLKEMGYTKAHLEQENGDLRLMLKEYQEAQISGVDAVVSLKDLREKFRALEQTHRNCTEKLRDKETEWRMQMEKLGGDLDRCLSQLESKDMLIREMRNELLCSYKSLELQIVENWEALIITTVVQSKFHESCSCIDTVKLNMQHRCEEVEKEIASVRKQLEERSCMIVQAQVEQKQQSEVIEKLQGIIEELEHAEQEHEKMQRQVGAYKEMLDTTSRDVHCIKDEASEKENNLQEKLREALGALDEANCALADRKNELSQLEINLHQQKQATEHLEQLKVDMQNELKGYMDSNHTLKRDLDAALVAKMEAEEVLIQEKVKLLGALDEANYVLSERNSELSQFENNFHQQKKALEHLKKLKVDMETELKTYMDENYILKRDLDVALIAKMESEECHTKEKEKLYGIISEKGKVIDELQQHIAVLEEENLGQKNDFGSLIKMEYEKSIQEVNSSYSEIVEVYDKKLLELEERVSSFEQKFTCREQEIMDMFDQEEADWYTLIAEKEIAISGIQRTVESVKLDIEQLLENAAAEVTNVQLEVNQLYRFAESLNSLNIIQEHDSLFKDMLIAECERELESLQVDLVLEKERSGNLKNLIEHLKAESTAEMTEKSKERQEVANKLKSLEERKEMLEEQLGVLKYRTTDLSNFVLQERADLVDELTGLTNTIGEVIYGGENLMSDFRRITHKVNEEEPSDDKSSLDKTKARTSASLIRNKSGHVLERRSPLKEHNH